MWMWPPAAVFLYHVVGDLILGKPDLSEFLETDTVASAIRTIADHSPGGANIIPVWKKPPSSHIEIENENADDGTGQQQQQRFVGILSALDIAAFLAREDNLDDQEKAMSTAVSEVVVPNRGTLKVVDTSTRLIDALEMMKQGVELLLVRKSSFSHGTASVASKRLSILHNSKCVSNTNPCAAVNNASSAWLDHENANMSPCSSMQSKYCCLCREDVLRFLIGCLGALAPLPLTSIASLGAINPNYSFLDASSSSPAIHALNNINHPGPPLAVVAVVETTPNSHHKIIGEISSTKLWRCDYLSVAWALANLSSGQFVTGVVVDVYLASRLLCPRRLNDITPKEKDREKETPPGPEEGSSLANGGQGVATTTTKLMRGLNSKSIDQFGSRSKNTYGLLTCRATSSLAAVMAQMLSHRASHVWVTEGDEKEVDDMVVGVVGYGDILSAVAATQSSVAAATPNFISSEETQNI